MKRKIYNVGVNDADYVTKPTINGKVVICPYYSKWISMLMRCYSSAYQAKKPSYIGCSVAPEWLSFMTFRAWMVQQDWQDKQLDKDIINPGNKIYSPEQCVFVSQQLNNLLIHNQSTNTTGYVGVSWDKAKEKYKAQINISGKKHYLGLFDSPKDAHKAWVVAKEKEIKKYLLTETDSRIVSGLKQHIRMLFNDN